MKQYISKDALVAEIERIKKEECPIDTYEGRSKLFYFEQFLSFINTLEVEEVDLEKEIKEQSDKYYSQCEKKLQEMGDDDNDLSFLSLNNYAKYFFELGLKAQKVE